MRRVLKPIALSVTLVGVGLVVADFAGAFGPCPSWVGFLGAACAALGPALAGPPARGRMTAVYWNGPDRLCIKKVSGTLHLVQETWRPRKPKVPDTFFMHPGLHAIVCRWTDVGIKVDFLAS